MARGMRAAVSGSFPDGMYGIFAELKVYFVQGSSSKAPSSTFIDRIEKHIEQVVESISTEDFLAKIQGVLQQAGMKRIMTINENDVIVFGYDPEDKENWREVFEAVLKNRNRSGGRDDWWILVSGWNEEFKLKQDVTFKEKHTRASPPMRVVIRALPAGLALQQGENFSSWMLRLQQTLRDKERVQTEEIRIRPRIEKYLQEYQQLLKAVFSVKEFSQTLRINLSGIDLESFRENYFAEQAS